MTTGFLAVTSSPIVACSRALIGALRTALSRSVAHAPLTVVLVAALVAMTTRPAMGQCPGDLTGNGVVDGLDLAGVLSAWGTQGGELGGDVNGDGIVAGADLAFVLGAWGPCAPVVGGVSPASGLPSGGVLITITGNYLSGTTAVTVDGVPATNVQAVSATKVTAVIPAGSLGAKAVAVTTPIGTTSLAGAFTYTLPPVIPSWATMLEPLADPAIVWDEGLRAAITATGLAWRVKDTATQMEMLLIPPGSFQMGCSASNQYECFSNESPVHTVTLTNAFYLGRYEVTQAQWQARMGSNPSWFRNPSSDVPAGQVPNRPVENVSWNMIAGSGGFMAQTGMRLPTEAEWEYAYRAGTTTAFHGFTGYPNGTNDDTLVGNIAWYYEGDCSAGAACQTRPVGGKAGNGFGLHDMAGNVFEWVNDWYGAYPWWGAQTDPTGPTTGDIRVLRGGSWDLNSIAVRGSFRSYSSPGNSGSNVGFRPARSP
jgi:formylglycine-generating enzyme required for sulfatase activity